MPRIFSLRPNDDPSAEEPPAASQKFARAARLFEALDGKDLTGALMGELAPSN
jgi:hypothetical protein